jgi:hypothetical protein
MAKKKAPVGAGVASVAVASEVIDAAARESAAKACKRKGGSNKDKGEAAGKTSVPVVRSNRLAAARKAEAEKVAAAEKAAAEAVESKRRRLQR